MIEFISALLFVESAALQEPATSPSEARTWREINITSDSAPGWLPSEQQEMLARHTAGRFFNLVDQARDQDAYAMLSPRTRELLPYGQFSQANDQFRKTAGNLKRRDFVKLTWTKDPANAPASGIYAALDASAVYDGVDRQCGYVILYQPPEGGPFQVMRTESNFIDNASAREIERTQSRAELDNLWAQLSANCPNFRAPK